MTTTDPGGHTTTLSYADDFSDGVNRNTQTYLTQITFPTTGGVSHIERIRYYHPTGLLYQQIDQNNQTTTHTYDNMNRPDVATYPDGGQVNLDYDDVARWARSKTLRAAGAWLVNYSRFDGLGRTWRNELCEDGADVCTTSIKTDTSYDSLGRVWKVTNPYRTTGDATYGLTETQYDALGRISKVIPPDGTPSSNNVATLYSLNVATVTDQAGKQRRSVSDALGRLIEVHEPNPTLATPAVTNYTYDALDNLLTVVQSGSRQRTFTYNSLLQLLTAANPESGAITYTYDNDGNLISKTDARGITTTYSYDALHRLTQKSYSDGTTPNLFFSYDVAPPWLSDLTNVVGRLVEARNQYAGSPGSTTASSVVSSYDALGHVVRQWQQTPSVSPGGHFVHYAYDLAGNLTSLTYPSGRKVTYAYDTASRLNQVRFDSFNGTPVGYNYLSSATYHPHGAPHVTTLGSGLVETNTYNNRLQPLQMTGVTGAFTYFNKQYNFYDGANRNNGNVMSIADQLNAGRSQNFSYDELNRLDQAYTDANSGADCWGLDHGYDIWANLLSVSVTKCSAPMLSIGVNTQNRITNAGFTYDAAGNLTADGSHTYQWDAESRMKSLDATAATYTYDANGNRVRKQVGTDSTEYIYFGGQVIAERNAASEWSDYIYAGSRRLARTDTYEDRIRTYGTYCSGCPWQWSIFWFPNAAGLNGYVIQPGDKLYVRQWQAGGARGGPGLWFTDGSYTGNVTYDQDGQLSNGDTFQNQWHYRRIDLTPVVGKTVNGVGLITEGWTPPGNWEIYYHEMVLISADGTVRTIYDRQKTVSLTVAGSPESTRGYDVNHIQCAGQWCYVMSTYFHGDHLGSARMTSSHEGYPTWSATYLPFGQEHKPQPTTNHFKFTGHERDVESGLDHTWFRQYSSAQGRWLSPDLLDGDVVDPQTLNLYAYVRNNPLKLVDRLGLADGCTLDGLDIDCGTAGRLVAKGAVAPCPKSDCFLVTLRGGDFYRFVPEQTTYRDVPQGGTEVILTEAHWERVPGDQARFGPVLAMAAAIAATDSPAPGPSDVVAAGYLIAAGATVAILAENAKHNKDIMRGLFNQAALHVGRLMNSPPEHADRPGWKKEVRAALDRAKNMLKRFKGQTREAFEEIIRQIEGKTPK